MPKKHILGDFWYEIVIKFMGKRKEIVTVVFAERIQNKIILSKVFQRILVLLTYFDDFIVLVYVHIR